MIKRSEHCTVFSLFMVYLVTIDSIHEVCEGMRTEVFRRFASSNFDPNCCFSIYHGDHVESLDLVSTNGEEARTWITGLKYLLAGISDEDSLAKRQRTRDQYPFNYVLWGGRWWTESIHSASMWPVSVCVNCDVLYVRVDISLHLVANGWGRPFQKLTKMEMGIWALERFYSCSTSSMWTFPSRKSKKCSRYILYFIFTVTLDQLNASPLNKGIIFFFLSYWPLTF